MNAEIIEREAVSHRTQASNELRGALKVRDGSSLGDFEADLLERDMMIVEPDQHEMQEIVIRDRPEKLTAQML